MANDSHLKSIENDAGVLGAGIGDILNIRCYVIADAMLAERDK